MKWCDELTRMPTGRPEPCSLAAGHEGIHLFVPAGDCVGRHSPFQTCHNCDDGFELFVASDGHTALRVKERRR